MEKLRRSCAPLIVAAVISSGAGPIVPKKCIESYNVAYERAKTDGSQIRIVLQRCREAAKCSADVQRADQAINRLQLRLGEWILNIAKASTRMQNSMTPEKCAEERERLLQTTDIPQEIIRSREENHPVLQKLTRWHKMLADMREELRALLQEIKAFDCNKSETT